MKSEGGPARELRFLRDWASLFAFMVILVILYNDPLLLLWWPQRPAQKIQGAVSPLDMSPDSIDDMYAGCRAETAALIDLFGVFEWHFNANFSFAWAVVERRARKPVHQQLKEDHANVVFIYTQFAQIRREFNHAVKTGKHKYNTEGFLFHYFYFYLTDAIQVLQQNQASCRTTYHRTWKRFDQRVTNKLMRFGAFIWASSDKQSFEFDGNVSCFEIHTCFGADVTYYSSIRKGGQVLIPTYEVFRITDVVTHDPWCSVVYKLQSTRTPRTDQNCKLTGGQSGWYSGAGLPGWHQGGAASMSACALLMVIVVFVLVRRKQKCFVAVMLGAVQVLIITVIVLSYPAKR